MRWISTSATNTFRRAPDLVTRRELLPPDTRIEEYQHAAIFRRAKQTSEADFRMGANRVDNSLAWTLLYFRT